MLDCVHQSDGHTLLAANLFKAVCKQKGSSNPCEKTSNLASAVARLHQSYHFHSKTSGDLLIDFRQLANIGSLWL